MGTEVKELKTYTIPIVALEDKQYEYDFESGDEFFAALEQELIQHGTFRTHLTLDKSSTMIRLDFHIRGAVELTCDRSLEPFEEPIDIRERLFLKFADHNEELTDEIELIQWDTQEINVAGYIFEFIGLALPMKKLHPRFRDPEEGTDETEEGKLVYRSGGIDADADGDDPQPTVDPRWEALRKLRDN